MAHEMNEAFTSRSDVISHYMSFVLAFSKEDRDVSKFCLEHKIKEDQFYNFFDSFAELETAIWNELMLASLQTVKTDESYASFKEEEKLLSLFYTFFENLELNRVYLISNLSDRKHLMDRLELFKMAKQSYIKYVEEIITSDFLISMGGSALGKLSSLGNKGLQEAFWIQCLCLIEFWKKDVSEGAERTDIAIEKSVRAADGYSGSGSP